MEYVRQGLYGYFLHCRSLCRLSYLPVYGLMGVSTAGLVYGGADFAYLSYVLAVMPFWLLIAADMTGFLLPVFLPLGLYIFARRRQSAQLLEMARATAYAVLVGFTLSTLLKAFAGRTSPPHAHPGETLGPLTDTSRDFNFGFLNEQVIGGWPSSHTTIAFALATVLACLLPPRWYYRAPLYGVALFIGIGVTFGFHWFSEFVAGALLGSLIGVVVGRHYAVRASSAIVRL